MKIALITSCSNKKKTIACKAKHLYDGQFFKGCLYLSNRLNADFYVLSAKHGLIDGDAIIEPYDKRLKSRADVDAITQKTLEKMKQILQDNDLVILMMGKIYLKVFASILNENNNIRYSVDKQGIGGFNQLIYILERMATKTILAFLKTHKILERGEIKQFLEGMNE